MGLALYGESTGSRHHDHDTQHDPPGPGEADPCGEQVFCLCKNCPDLATTSCQGMTSPTPLQHLKHLNAPVAPWCTLSGLLTNDCPDMD